MKNLLLTLHIENLAVIKELDINFGSGLNVITGETGAGKSIVIDAINIVLGGRVSKSFIRQGENFCQVSAVFSNIDNIKNFIQDLGYVCNEDYVLIYREFNLNGKNICKINGRPATNNILKQLGKYLVNIYGQHDSFTLFSPESHIKYIDKFANTKESIFEYKKIYDGMIDLNKKIKCLNIDDREKERKIDLLNYQIKELEEANILIGEREKLFSLKNIYVNYDKICKNINFVKEIMQENNNENSGISILEKVHLILKEISSYDSNLENIKEKFSNIYYETIDCMSDLYSYYESLEYDPNKLESIESRLDELHRLGIKYGSTEEEMLEFLSKSRDELDSIKKIDDETLKLKEEYKVLENKAQDLCMIISDKRLRAGKEFINKIENELKFLNMPHVTLKLSHSIDKMKDNGFDNIEILLSVNKGDSEKSISKVASGGELSRIMLAIQTVIADDSIETLIFDEVDTGVSGEAANKIGSKLKQISKDHQVICITHLPQIACLPDHHYLIEKYVNEKGTFTKIKKLNFDARKMELARIISGSNITDITLNTAQEMLNLNGIRE